MAYVYYWPPPLVRLGDKKQAPVKPGRFYLFHPFYYNLRQERLDTRSSARSFVGSCILSESEELWLNLDW